MENNRWTKEQSSGNFWAAADEWIQEDLKKASGVEEKEDTKKDKKEEKIDAKKDKKEEKIEVKEKWYGKRISM